MRWASLNQLRRIRYSCMLLQEPKPWKYSKLTCTFISRQSSMWPKLKIVSTLEPASSIRSICLSLNQLSKYHYKLIQRLLIIWFSHWIKLLLLSSQAKSLICIDKSSYTHKNSIFKFQRFRIVKFMESTMK